MTGNINLILGIDLLQYKVPKMDLRDHQQEILDL